MFTYEYIYTRICHIYDMRGSEYCIYMYVYMCLCVCIRLYIYICIRMCVYIYTHLWRRMIRLDQLREGYEFEALDDIEAAEREEQARLENER